MREQKPVRMWAVATESGGRRIIFQSSIARRRYEAIDNVCFYLGGEWGDLRKQLHLSAVRVLVTIEDAAPGRYTGGS